MISGTVRRGTPRPLFVPTFIDVALLPVDGEKAVVGYCAWSSEPSGSSENCIHIMNLAVALEFRSWLETMAAGGWGRVHGHPILQHVGSAPFRRLGGH